MSDENVRTLVLDKYIDETIDFVKEKTGANTGKKKRRRRRTKKQIQDARALDSVVDNILQMKEGERKAQLLRPIIPIREWLNNEYYCGSEVFNLYPFWKEHLIKIYESPVLINEIILTGRIRNW